MPTPSLDSDPFIVDETFKLKAVSFEAHRLWASCKDGYKALAAMALTMAIEDSAVTGLRESCREFLDTDFFGLCCAILDIDPDIAYCSMLEQYKKKAKHPKKDWMYVPKTRDEKTRRK